MKNKLHWRNKLYLLVFVVIAILLVKYYPNIKSIVNDQEQIQNWVSSYGVYGPLALIVLHVLFLLGGFLILPGPWIAAIGVFLYGPWINFVVVMIGSFIGTTTFFFIVKSIGEEKTQKWLKKISKNQDLKKVEQFFKKHEKAALVLSRVIPGLPQEVVTAFCALEGMATKDFIIWNMVGYAPRVLLESFFLQEMEHGFQSPFGRLIFLIILVGTIVYLVRQPVTKYYKKHKKKKKK